MLSGVRTARRVIASGVAAVALAAGQAGALGASLPAPVRCAACYHPPLVAPWQWQIDPPNTHISFTDQKGRTINAVMWDIDPAFTTAVGAAGDIARLHARHKKVFCYVDVGSGEEFRTARSGAPYWFQFARFAPADLGRTYYGFPDERWLNPSSPHVRRIMSRRFAYAKKQGCDGVEPDNVDAYTHDTQPSPGDHGTGFQLTVGDQLAYNTFIANTAHALRLSVLLKNDDGQMTSITTGHHQLRDYFDGALVEQCAQYGFCDEYTAFTRQRKPVFAAEYVGGQHVACAPLNRLNLNGIRKHLDLGVWRIGCR
jgi:hypothetical protein